MNRVKMVNIYAEYFGTTKREAREKVSLALKTLTPDIAKRYFQAIEDTLKNEAYKAYYED